MQIGCELATEGFGPKELIRQAILAEHAEQRALAMRSWGNLTQAEIGGRQLTSEPAGSEGTGS
jgi:hypothetical protein